MPARRRRGALGRWRLGGGLLAGVLVGMLATSTGPAVVPTTDQLRVSGTVGPAGSAQVTDPAPPAGAAERTASPPGPAVPVTTRGGGDPASRTVSLVTGDRVTMIDGDRIAVRRAPGRAGVIFLTRRDNGHVHVIPHDALPMLQTGRLDSRLFDVTALLDRGYDDSLGHLPLTVTLGAPPTGPSATPAPGAPTPTPAASVPGAPTPAVAGAVRAAIRGAGGRIVGGTPGTGALAVHATDLAALWRGLTVPGPRGSTLLAGVSDVRLGGPRAGEVRNQPGEVRNQPGEPSTGRDAAAGGPAPTARSGQQPAESYTVTVRHLDRTGAAPSRDYLTGLFPIDGGRYIDVYDPDGTATVRVPAGTYALASSIITGDGPDPELTYLVRPEVSVTSDIEITVDARLGQPLSITVPHPDASLALFELTAEVHGDGFANGSGFIVDGLAGESLAGVTTASLGPDEARPWLRTAVWASFAQPDADTAGTPYAYLLSWRIDGRMVTGFQRRVEASQLATVQARLARQGPADAHGLAYPVRPDGGVSAAVTFRLTLPTTFTRYVNTDDGVRWRSVLEEVTQVGNRVVRLSTLRGPERRYQAGRVYQERWNQAVFGPSLNDPVWPEEYLVRAGDLMTIAVPTHSDAYGHTGDSAFTSARTRVLRDGVEIATALDPLTQVAVPAEAGRYQVGVELARGAPATLSTRVDVEWTFDSGHVAGQQAQRLPISVVRFAPELDDHNTAPAGREVTVGVTVQPQPGSAATEPASLSVEVSYDDGVTWLTAPVDTVDGQRLLRLTHPDGDRFVSLRAAATDTAGNTVRQTIIRAYRLAA